MSENKIYWRSGGDGRRRKRRSLMVLLGLQWVESKIRGLATHMTRGGFIWARVKNSKERIVFTWDIYCERDVYSIEDALGNVLF